jgi:glycosyltransferase involved in cell wall biosynthesis
MTANPIKVLFMQSQEYSGPDSQIQASLMTHLPRDRFEVHCAVPAARDGELSPPARVVHELADVHVRPTRFGPSLEPGWKAKAAALAESLPAAVSLAGLARYIRTQRIDVVHSTEKPRDTIYGVSLAKIGGARSVVHLHVAVAPWMRSGVRRAMHHADALVGVSRFIADDTIAMGYPPQRVHAVLNGLELSNWLDLDLEVDGAAVRAEFDMAADAPLLVTASRLFRAKGQHLIVAALPAVRAHFPAVKLLIVGRDDTRAGGGASYSAELRRMVSELGLEDNVAFTGWRPDLNRLMAACDAFVMPSLEEPFGMVYVEAMALRRPVIALDSGGAKEIVDHGGSGLLSPPGDVGSIAEHITRLLADPALRRRMGEHGRRRVIERFSSERMTDDMAAVYTSLVDRRGRR